jgi:hypothetical protein
MEAYLITQGRERWLSEEPDEAKAAEVNEDNGCKAGIQLHVSGALRAIVQRAKTSKEAWNALRDEYVGSLKVRQPLLMAQVTELRQGRDSVVRYNDRAKRLRDQFEDLALKESLPLLCH